MSTIAHGYYFGGRYPIGVPATLRFAAGEAVLVGEDISKNYFVSRLKISPRTGCADRFIAFPDGGQFQCPDDPFLDHLPQDSRTEGVAAWLEARVGVALTGVVLTAALLLVVYLYGLPAAAERIVHHIPIETEKALGDQVMKWLDDNRWFRLTGIDEDMRFMVNQDFAELVDDLPMHTHYRLEFRNSALGPNAIALPGGTIVITDDMVYRAETLDEIAAVLAHEIGHVERRHTLRHILQNSAVAVVVATLTTDAASLSVAVAGLPALLAQLKYSRQFETEADDYAFELLKRNDRSPAAFATLMERLFKDNDEDGDYAFLSTHPFTAERIQRARAAATQ